MKLIEPFHLFISRWWRPLLFFLWICALAGLLQRKAYTAFLRPEFGIVLGLGLATLVGFFLAGMSPRTPPLKLSTHQGLRALILLLPLVYLLNAQGASLDAQAFLNRSVGSPTVSGNARPMPEPAGAVSGDDFAREQEGAERQGKIPTVTLLDLYDAPDLYEGKRIRLLAMWLNDENSRKDFGEHARVAFRFVINCCAADAIPAAVVLLPDQPLVERENSAWITVEGVFHAKDIDSRRVPMLLHVRVSSAEKPKQPYLF